MRPDYSANARHRGANLTSNKNAWQDQAACLNYVELHTEAGSQLDSRKWKDNQKNAPAVRAQLDMCAHCPVIQECRQLGREVDFPGKSGRWGIYGGLIPMERYREDQQHNRASRPKNTNEAHCRRCDTTKPLNKFRDWPKRRSCTDCLNKQERERHTRALATEEGRERNRANTARSRAKAAS